ncbi:GNAT family N-acetyltransferase [Chloroflexi bacterium TSY]|nr:GNAT family N-acetyltransferase [Chloroflexi bacterium TSY]
MKEMMSVPADQVSPQLRSLFDEDQPLAIRCFAVLDGSIRGQIWTDDLAQPTWGAAQEWAWGTLFLAGQPSANLVHDLIEKLQRDGGVELGLWPDHPYNQLLPSAPDVDTWELEFTNRLWGTDPAPDLDVPAGCELLPIDATWFERCRDRDVYIRYFGSAERTLEITRSRISQR